jgi:hypothetical protein
MAMTNWLVFTYGNLSRTVPEGSADERLWRNEGYELVWDKAPSQFEGQAFAAINHGCMPDDYADAWSYMGAAYPLPLGVHPGA